MADRFMLLLSLFGILWFHNSVAAEELDDALLTTPASPGVIALEEL